MTEENRDVPFETMLSPPWSSSSCLVCGDKATHRAPSVDRPWVDKLPIIRWLRKLYIAPPRWTVVTRGKRKLCALHFSLAEQMADNQVNERRYTQAQLNGREFMQVYTFNRQLEERIKDMEAEC